MKINFLSLDFYIYMYMINVLERLHNYTIFSNKKDIGTLLFQIKTNKYIDNVCFSIISLFRLCTLQHLSRTLYYLSFWGVGSH